jgi:predicted nucleic acid-binding protein
MDFVVNEWLPEYFRRNATNEERHVLEAFLNKFMESEDRIFVRRPSAFLDKIHRFSSELQAFPNRRQELSKFISLILYNSDKCRLIDDLEYNLQHEIEQKLSDTGNFASDLYLFEAAAATDSKIIVTTDIKLITFMKDETDYRLFRPEDFLSEFYDILL